MSLSDSDYDDYNDLSPEQQEEILIKRSRNIAIKKAKDDFNNGLLLSNQSIVLPFDFIAEDIKNKYIDYNNKSNFIIAPYNILEEIENFNKSILLVEDYKNNRPFVIKINNILFTIIDFINDEYFYVSDDYYNLYFQSIQNIEIKYIINIYDINKVILKPLEKEFLLEQNHLSLLDNNIGVKYRVLYENLIIKTDKNINFIVDKIIINDEESEYGYSVENDLIIDFYIPEEQYNIWSKEIKEIENNRKSNMEKLKNISINNSKKLTKEELRLSRLKYFEKNNN